MHQDEVSNQTTNHSQNVSQAVTSPELASTYKPTFRKPFSTYTEDRPAIPYVVDGLLKQGGFSILGAKPKLGKSSISRYISVAVTKGTLCLGRETSKGEVILVSLEDPDDHVDDCLEVLNYDPRTDSPIHILEEVPSKEEERIDVLRNKLTEHPDVRLVVVDTLSKFVGVGDINDYTKMQTAIMPLRKLAKDFPHVHVLALHHCKKVQTDSVFDSILGSSAIRAETDANIAIYEVEGQRLITAEVRRGRKIEPTIIRAEIVNSSNDGAEVVRDFTLDEQFDAWKSGQDQKKDARRQAGYEERIIRFLEEQEDQSASQKSILDGVKGSAPAKFAAIKRLHANGFLTESGVKGSPKSPLRYRLNIDLQGTDDVSEFLRRHLVKGGGITATVQ